MMTFSTCRKCGKDGDENNYSSAGVKNGKKYLRKTCNTCYGKTKAIYRIKKREWYVNLKNNLSCEACGYSKLTHKNFSPQAIHFHHKEGNKEFTVSSAVYMGYSRSKIINEINKCSVLCSRCHAEEHDNLN